MSWNDRIADGARNWSQFLLQNQSLIHEDDVLNSQNLGENLGFVFSSPAQPLCSNASETSCVRCSQVVTGWYSEISNYDFYAGKAINASLPWLHFTQMVWRGSSELGVGVASANGSHYVVARYSPRGNVPGTFQRNVPRLLPPTATTTSPATTTAIPVDNCTSSPCLNQGTCNRFPGGYNCTCQAAFYGDNCEIYNNCTSSPCLNQGTCNRFPGGYNCTCQAGFYGNNCEIFDNCTSSPCLNQGTCYTYPGGYNCTCQEAFYGDNCEIFDNCTSSPCLNQGTCNRYPGGYNCTCQAGFYGDTCETFDNCTSSPCLNQGTCNTYPGGFNCTCQEAFYGDNCEIFDNCTSSPCLNQGTCNTYPGGYNCTCQAGFYGDNCEIYDSSTTTITPQTQPSQGRDESVVLVIRGLDKEKWTQKMEDQFKREVAKLATKYCTTKQTGCRSIPTSSRRKRSSDNMTFSDDRVYILPGYPRQLVQDPPTALLAFFLQFPQETSDDLVPKEVLKAIMESNVSNIEESLSVTIINVQLLISPTTVPIEEKSEKEKEWKPSIAFIIGVSVGGGVLLAIIVAILLVCKKLNRKETSGSYQMHHIS